MRQWLTGRYGLTGVLHVLEADGVDTLSFDELEPNPRTAKPLTSLVEVHQATLQQTDHLRLSPSLSATRSRKPMSDKTGQLFGQACLRSEIGLFYVLVVNNILGATT